MSDEQAGHAPPSLLRVLGLVFGLAVVVGGMVGSGIMRAPGVVALGLTSPALILLAWAVGGVVAMLSAAARVWLRKTCKVTGSVRIRRFPLQGCGAHRRKRASRRGPGWCNRPARR